MPDQSSSSLHPELRRDPLSGRWNVIAGSRQGRPNQPATGCPFCVGGLEAPEPYDTRSFPNRWPSLVPGDPSPLEGQRQPARGACEVVLYSPDHEGSLATIGHEAVRRVVDLWADRTRELLARDEVRYVLCFENRGAEVGATIPHPHGQIYALPFIPPEVERELQVADLEGCPLCAGSSRSNAELEVAAAGTWSAQVPFASAWPYGLLLSPAAHVPDLQSLDDAGRDDLATLLADVVGRYDRLFDRPFPYMMWVHPGAHLHVHFAPPWRSAGTPRYVAAGEVGTGTFFNPVAPEQAARELRNA